MIGCPSRHQPSMVMGSGIFNNKPIPTLKTDSPVHEMEIIPC